MTLAHLLKLRTSSLRNREWKYLWHWIHIFAVWLRLILGSIFYSFGSMCTLQSLISVGKEHFKNDIAESICYSSFKARGFPEKQSVELSIKIHKCVSISVTWRITIGKAAVKTYKGGGNCFRLYGTPSYWNKLPDSNVKSDHNFRSLTFLVWIVKSIWGSKF